MLKVSCPNGHRISAAAEHAGKRVKCPKCGAVVRLPEPEVETQPDDDWDLSSDGATDDGGNAREDYGSWNAGDEEAPALPPRTKSVNRKAQKQIVSPAPARLAPDASTGQLQKYVIAAAGVAGLLALAMVLMVWKFTSTGAEESSVAQPTVAPSTPLENSEVPVAAEATAAGPTTSPPQSPPPVSVSAAATENASPEIGDSLPVNQNAVAKSGTLAADPGATDNTNTGSASSSESKAEIPWNIRPPETHNLVFDERFVLSFKLAPGKLQFAYVAEGQPAPTEASDWTPVTGELTTSDDVESTLPLAAAIMKDQDVIILNPGKLPATNGKAAPLLIRIGSEVMEVVAVDDFKGVVEVKRTSPIAHSVSEKVELLKAGAASVATNQGRPFLQNDVEMHWFPPKELAGRGTIFVRYTDRREKTRVGFGWRVHIADADTIAQLNREERGPEDDGLKPLSAPVWKYAVAPLSPLTPSAKSALDAANADIAKMVAKVRRKKSGVGIRFEQESPEKRRILIRSLDADSSDDEAVLIPPGAGVELLELDIRTAKATEIVSLKTETVSLVGDPVVSRDEEKRLRKQEITGIMNGVDSETATEQPGNSFLQKSRPCILSAEDGKIVFAVGLDDKLTRTSLETLKQEARVQLPSRCEAICLCSEGLVALCRIPDSRNEFLLNDTAWRLIDFGAAQVQSSSSGRLYLLNPETLKVKKSYLFRGNCIAGNPNDPTIYVGDEAQICVINMETATLTDVISVWHDVTPAASTSESEQGSKQVALRGNYDLCCDVDGATLLAIGTSPGSFDMGAAGIYRFRIGNGTAEYHESLRGRAFDGSNWCISRDGNLLSFRVAATGQSFITSTDSFSQVMPNVGTRMPLGVLSAMDSDSKAYLAVYKRSDLLSGYTLGLSQGRKSFQVEIGQSIPSDLRPLGKGRFLLTTNSKTHLVQVNAEADFWPFEADLALETPALPPKGAVTVPESPLKPSDKLPAGRIEFDRLGLEFLTWSPSGDAYFLSETQRTDDPRVFLSVVHRIDAISNTETHQWTSEGSAAFNQCQVSARGILLKEHFTNDVVLLSFDDLSLLWRINGGRFISFTASPEHNILVGSRDGYGIMVLDARTQTVIAWDGLLNHRIPELPWKSFSVLASNDPNVILLKTGNEYRELRVNNGLLELASEKVIPEEVVERTSRAGFCPEGYMFELDSETVMMTSPEGDTKRLSLLGHATKIWPHPTKRNRIALEFSRKVAIAEFMP